MGHYVAIAWKYQIQWKCSKVALFGNIHMTLRNYTIAFGSSNVDHPRLQIDMEEVAEMRRMGLSITKIREIIGVSRSTSYRILEDSYRCNRYL